MCVGALLHQQPAQLCTQAGAPQAVAAQCVALHAPCRRAEPEVSTEGTTAACAPSHEVTHPRPAHPLRAQVRANTSTLDKAAKEKTTFKDVAGCDEAKVRALLLGPQFIIYGYACIIWWLQ